MKSLSQMPLFPTRDANDLHPFSQFLLGEKESVVIPLAGGAQTLDNRLAASVVMHTRL